MNSRTRVFQAAALLLRDEKGAPNHDALEVFNQHYYQARSERLPVQEAGEVAMRAALGH